MRKFGFLVLNLFVLFFLSSLDAKKKRPYVMPQQNLEKETMIPFLDIDRLRTKMQNEPPLWMKEQIAEDFKEFENIGISKTNVDATFAAIRKNYPHSYLVRYRIIDNELYRYFPKNPHLSFRSEYEPASVFPCEEPISLLDNTTEKALKTLLHLIPFKDLDFIISYIDGMPIAQMMPDRFYFTDSKSLQAPILSPAKLKGTPYVVLIPDWRSLGDWWALDIKSVLSAMQKTPWSEKKNFAFWRGSLTRMLRLTFCGRMSLFPEYIDAKLNIKVDDVNLQTYLEKNGLFGAKVSWEEYLGYKYLPVLDGVMCAAPAYQWHLLSNCVTLKQESEEIQWFYKALQPYVHYIPFNNDFSNIIEQIQMAEQNDALCQEIAQRSTQFALENLMFEDVYLYFYLMLKHYSSLQNLNREEISKEIRTDQRWVNIHNRSQLEHSAKRANMNGYVHGCTPY